MGLNVRQLKFIEEYLVDGNASRSAKAAGYSPKTSYAIGHQLLKNLEVSTAIAQARQKAHERAGIAASDITKELGHLAFANISDIITWDRRGRLTITPSAELSADVLAAVAEISETESKTGEHLLRIKMHSKTTAIDLLTRLRTIEDLAQKVEALQMMVQSQPAFGHHRNGHATHAR